MSPITDRQVAINLFSDPSGYRFTDQGKAHFFPTVEKVHAYFLHDTDYDSVKLCHEGKKVYLHFTLDEIEVYETKRALRKTLSQESGGAWIEEKVGQKPRYFVEEKGWFVNSLKEVSKKECIPKEPILQKIVGVGLGVLSLAPGISELARQVPFSCNEVAIGLISLHQKNPFLGVLGLSSIVKTQAMETEFQVNNYTTDNQWNSRVASFADGDFVVTWESHGQVGEEYEIYGQRYDSGIHGDGEFRVNNYTTSSQRSQDVASLVDGSFVVVWASLGQDGNSYGVYGQRYDDMGLTQGGEFQINNSTAGSQGDPKVASRKNGGFVVTWAGPDSNGLGVFARIYNATGVPTGGEFLVNTWINGSQWNPSIAKFNGVGFVVVWESDSQDGDQGGIYGQLYTQAGVKSGDEFRVNTFLSNRQWFPSVGGLSDGGFVVTWNSGAQDGNFTGIYGQIYTSIGTPFGEEFQVSNYTIGSQRYPVVAGFASGGFVIAWESFNRDGDRWGVYCRRYNSEGLPLENDFRVNTNTTNDQRSPSIATFDDGGFVITWQSEGQDGDRHGVYGKKFNGTVTDTSQSSSLASGVNLTSFSSFNNRMNFSSGSFEREVSPSTFLSTRTGVGGSTTSPLPITSSISYITNTSVVESDAQMPSTSTNIIYNQIIDLTNIIYGESYPIFLDGERVGTFIFTGGSGEFDGENGNQLTVEFDPTAYQPEDGDSIILFTLDEYYEGDDWDLTLSGSSYTCVNIIGEINSSEESSYNYVVKLDYASCTISSKQRLFSGLPLVTYYV